MIRELLIPDWPAPANIRAVTTTRQGGVSHAPYATLNLGFHTADDPENVAANCRRLQARLGLAEAPFWLKQVHGNDVVRAQKVSSEPPVADAVWSDVPGLACVVLTADCLPILLCDSEGTRIAAVHGGWRSLAANIIEHTIAAMGIAASDLVAWLGPAIGPAAFEVGPEVRGMFVERWPETAAAFRAGEGDRWFCDIYSIARTQLRACGVGQIFGGGFCTVADPDRFYSYRRDGETGRMASLIWLAAPGVAE